MKVVIDTNVYLSALIVPGSIPSRVIEYVVNHGNLLLSDAIFDEISSRLNSKKFDRYLKRTTRRDILKWLKIVAEFSDPVVTINDCPDANDNMILELAVSENVQVIVTGDKILLGMSPYRNIPILTPKQFLEVF